MQFFIKMLLAVVAFYVAKTGFFDLNVTTSVAVIVLSGCLSIGLFFCGIALMFSAFKSQNSTPVQPKASKAKASTKASTKKSKDKRSTKSGS